MTLLTPIIVLTSICFLLGILLVLSDKFIADYGECKLIVSEDEEFTVQGGDTILSYLSSHNINIPAACGGKASCGYCKVKVLSGNGQLLPTERGFITRDEKKEGIRLACQVKVKSDMEIFMPDFIETVKNIVKNNLYDPKLKWRFNIAGQKNGNSKTRKSQIKVDSEEISRIHGMIENYKNMPGALVPVLQSVNSSYKYLPEYSLNCVSEALDIPLSSVYRVATFYNSFSLKPRGKHLIKVCMGTSCYVKGGKEILQSLEKLLDIKVGENTDDSKFSLETVNCIGCCGQSPVMSVNDDIYGYLKQNMMHDILRNYS